MMQGLFFSSVLSVGEDMDFKEAIFGASSRGARSPSGAVGCASRPMGKVPPAAVFRVTPRGRGVVRPGADAIPGTKRIATSNEHNIN
jgi:hypothetical protein